MQVVRRFVLSLLSVTGVLALASGAGAGGIDTYQAPVSGSDLLQVERAHAEPGHLRPFTRLSLAYNDDPLVWRNENGTETRLIDNQFGAYAALGLSLWQRLHVAALVPLYLQSGEQTAGGASIDGFALGDVALDLRFALLTRHEPLELALSSRFTLPSGNEGRYVGDGHASASLGGIISREFGEGGLLLTASLRANLRDRATEGTNTGGSALHFGLGAALPVSGALALSCEGEVATEYSNFLAAAATPASLLFGGRYGFTGWTTHLGVGPGLSRGVGTPDLRVLGMIGTTLDEVPTPVDTTQGPASVSDADRDGVEDSRDLCRSEAEDRDDFEDADGCPDLDDDADGITDRTDACPRAAEDKNSVQDTDGCPELDGGAGPAAAASDACQGEAGDKDSVQGKEACPELDNDADGIADASDQCPSEKETINGSDDQDGCPDLLRVEQEQIRTLEPIYFEPGSDRVQARSLPLLRELAAVIASREDLGMISVEGHTDDVGREQANQALSQKRADAIRRILIESGVAAQRLTSTGYGEMQPIASNESAAGREQNRRVEFRLAGAVSASSAP